MVIRLFGRHTLLACLCLLAVAIAVTMAVNSGRSQPNLLSSSNSSASSDLYAYKNVSGSKEDPSGPNSSSVSSAPSASASPVSSSSTASSAVPAAVGKEQEMRAVWVPYLSLDMSRETDKSEQGFQKKFNAIVSQAKACGMNTLVVQVRPFGDALYKSSYFPWSHVTGGTQGVNPGYDPLADMVSAGHKAGLKIHAWVNPLRIQTSSSTPSILAEGNPYNTFRKDPAKADWVVDFQGGKYYNPAYAQVRKLIADGVKEIVQNYDVDGVQFDDYFYPSQDASFDKTAYAAYCASAKNAGTPLSLLEWRQGNISALVSQVYQEVKEAKPEVPFGIAPQANVQNDRNMGADVESWCTVRGYVDYICPQLYVNFQNPVLPYDKAAQTWRSMVTSKDVKLYFGLAVYKANSDADSGTWKTSSNILATQVDYGRKEKCDGFMFYSCDYLNSAQTKAEVQNVMKVLNG